MDQGRVLIANSMMALALCTPCAQRSFAQDSPKKTDAAASGKKAQAEQLISNAERSKPASISVDQEETILAFVLKNDAPLHGLLGSLRASRPVEYHRALVDLQRVTERLAQIKKNRPYAYDLEVKKWQAHSKVQMLAARLATNPNPEVKTKLREAIEERAEIELQLLRADREAAAKRLSLLDEQIAQSESSRQNRVQQQFDRTVAASRRARNTKSTDASKKRPESEGAVPTGTESTSKAPASNESGDTDSSKSKKLTDSAKREGATP